MTVRKLIQVLEGFPLGAPVIVENETGYDELMEAGVALGNWMTYLDEPPDALYLKSTPQKAPNAD